MELKEVRYEVDRPESEQLQENDEMLPIVTQANGVGLLYEQGRSKAGAGGGPQAR